MMEGTLHLARIWIGSAISNKSTQTKPVLPLSYEHSSQVKDQGRWQCCHNKHKNFPISLHMMYFYFPNTPHTRAAHFNLLTCIYVPGNCILCTVLHHTILSGHL